MEHSDNGKNSGIYTHGVCACLYGDDTGKFLLTGPNQNYMVI